MLEDESVAPAGERVAYKARLHWILFAPPLVFFVAGLAAIPFQPMTAIVLLLFAAVAILAAYAKYASTEIVITNRRVIYKSGLLSRSMIEMHKDRIESIDVSQPLLGRLFGFGAVTVRGTGGGIEPILNVAHPFELRQHVASLAA